MAAGTVRGAIKGYSRAFYETGDVHNQMPLATIDVQQSSEPGRSGLRLANWGKIPSDRTVIAGNFVLQTGSCNSDAAYRSTGVGLSHAH